MRFYALIFSGVFTDLVVDDCVSVHEKQTNKTSWLIYSAILNSDMSMYYKELCENLTMLFSKLM